MSYVFLLDAQNYAYSLRRHVPVNHLYKFAEKGLKIAQLYFIMLSGSVEGNYSNSWSQSNLRSGMWTAE